uniref:N-acetyltransferase n=1 Tax=Anaerolinea thermolimosa TaxID=229919 RepID=A0A7C4PLE4_9CHLR
MKDHFIFESRELRLTPLQIEQDAPVMAQWSQDLEIARRLRSDRPARPLSVSEARKVFEAWLKEVETSNRNTLFALRPQEDDRLVGFLRIMGILWLHGTANFDLLLGNEEDRMRYADEALVLGLNYAFEELNLFRVSAQVPEYDVAGRALYDRARFTLEVRQRQAVFHEGRTWDRLQFGMLRPEWEVFYRREGVAL